MYNVTSLCAIKPHFSSVKPTTMLNYFGISMSSGFLENSVVLGMEMILRRWLTHLLSLDLDLNLHGKYACYALRIINNNGTIIT